MMTIDEIKHMQKVVAEAFGDPVGVRDEVRVREALKRPCETNRGIPVYPTLLNKISCVVHELLQHKPFNGSNRRTAFCFMAYALDQNGYELRPDQKALEGLLTGIELGFTTVHRTTAWIKGHIVRRRA